MKNWLIVLFALLIPGFSVAQGGLMRFQINAAGSSNPHALTIFQNKLFFFADNGSTGNELMSYDGNTISLEADITPGATGTDLKSNMTMLNGKLYFTVSTVAAGAELYVYDGISTPAMVKDIAPGAASSTPDHLISLGNKLYFRATVPPQQEYALCSYDPVADSVQVIKSGLEPAYGKDIAVYNNKIYFASQAKPASGNALYAYDPATNTVTTTINTDSMVSSVSGMLPYNGKLYFGYSTYPDGTELYEYDGVNSPQMVTDFDKTWGMAIDYLAAAKGGIFFYAKLKATYPSLYRYDITSKQTFKITDSIFTLISYPVLFNYHDDIYLSASTTNNAYMLLYIYNGITLQSLMQKCPFLSLVQACSQYAIYKDELYFRGTDGNSLQLYKFNDTILGIQNVLLIDKVQVYPNPTVNNVLIQLTLREPTNLYTRLTDAAGQVVYTSGLKHFSAATQDIVISLQDYAKGNYFYTICNTTGAILAAGKLVKN